MHAFLPTLTTALPVLVYLCVSVPQGCCSALYDALSFPAPRLRVLALEQVHDYITLPRDLSISVNLFAKSARRLREVCLSVHSLETMLREPVPAFDCVRRADLRPWLEPRVRPAAFFPHLRALWLDAPSAHFETVVVLGNKDTDVPVVPPEVNLGGLQLEHLSISKGLLPYVRSETPLRALRYVQQIGASPLSETLWPEATTREELHGHLTRANRMVRISFGPSSGTWTRALSPWSPEQDPPAQLLFNSLALLAARLVTFTVHKQYIPIFLRCQIALDALAELVVDYTKSREEAGSFDFAAHEHGVQCPALKILSLLSVDGKAETGRDAVVSLAEAVGHLGHSAPISDLRLATPQPAPSSHRHHVRDGCAPAFGPEASSVFWVALKSW